MDTGRAQNEDLAIPSRVPKEQTRFADIHIYLRPYIYVYVYTYIYV